ncbi:MAG: AAA family ATPase [gamma proteobacterium symbiont of Phacoides pectinatus]
MHESPQPIHTEADHHALIEGLLRQLADAGEQELITTHISSVILAGEYAYKIKKPLDLGFLDFSTLERRRFCCEEELRLNARLAPGIYLDVLPITGTLRQPVLGGDGELLEYVVRMRRFDQRGLLSSHLDLLDPAVIDTIARRVARFHGEIARAPAASEYGEPAHLAQPMWDNFTHIRQLVDNAEVTPRLEALEHWTRQRYQALGGLLSQRKRDGYIRECHGDLHLGNIALVGTDPLIFDGIEFNPGLRWIDTMSELAFLLMDLQEKGRPELATRALNSYLAETGDYQGVALLRFYQVYRAMVRAKVAAIMASQAVPPAKPDYTAFRAYLALAESYMRDASPCLMLTRGPSGSGKSTKARDLLGRVPAIWLRSDVERKRLAGLRARDSSGSALDGGIYSAEFTRRTYAHLHALAGEVLAAGYAVLVDATFLDRARREPFYGLAEELGCPVLVLDLQVPEALLRERVERRAARGGSVSEAGLEVLERQLAGYRPLDDDEREHTIVLIPDDATWVGRVAERCG